MSADSGFGSNLRPDTAAAQARQGALIAESLNFLGMQGKRFEYLEELAGTVATECARRDPASACDKTALLSTRKYKIRLLEFIQRYPQNMPRERKCEMKAWLLQLKYAEQVDENEVLSARLAQIEAKLAEVEASAEV